VFEEGDIYWCTADIGWITGHSYIVYGPLLSGATTMLFEGVPSYPDAGRFWQIVEENKVNIFYTAPTAIRALEAKGLEYVHPYNLSSLKVLGTVGEPINEDAWHWYDKEIGKENSPIVDTWWQTETGGIMISNLAGVTPAKLEIIMPPVSVCHQVSTIGQLLLPISLSYQCQASSFIGSPTVPKTFNEDKL
jgi:acetyl-CoA synthetase